MQAIIPYENHIDGFFLTHSQSPEIINFDSIFPYQNSPDFRAILITPFISDIVKMISPNSILGMHLALSKLEKGPIPSKQSIW